MIDSTTFPSKIKYKDDCFSMADSTYIDENTVKSKVLNLEDLEHISDEELDAVFSFVKDDSTEIIKSRIIKIDKAEGYLLLDVSGNA